MASLSSTMPSTLVYLVLPSRIALMAASLMLSGVSKSGSPAAREITFRPCAFSSRAFASAARVADGFTRASAADSSDMAGRLPGQVERNGRGFSRRRCKGKAGLACGTGFRRVRLSKATPGDADAPFRPPFRRRARRLRAAGPPAGAPPSLTPRREQATGGHASHPALHQRNGRQGLADAGGVLRPV